MLLNHIHLSSWVAVLSLQEIYGYSLAIVMQSILNAMSSTSSFPQTRVVGGFLIYFQENLTLHPIAGAFPILLKAC